MGMAAVQDDICGHGGGRPGPGGALSSVGGGVRRGQTGKRGRWKTMRRLSSSRKILIMYGSRRNAVGAVRWGGNADYM